MKPGTWAWHDMVWAKAVGHGNRRIRRAARAGRRPRFVWLVNHKGRRLAYSDVGARRLLDEYGKARP